MKRGFSIAESLIACALLSGMAVCLFGVWAMHSKASGHSQDMLVASAWAEQVMEGELAKGYTSKQTANPPETFRVTHFVGDVPIAKEYLWKVYVQDPDPLAPVPGLKQVRVEVSWEHGGQWRTWHVCSQMSWQG